MNLKTRLKSYGFWVSLASAVFLILKVAGQSLGFSVDESLYNDIFTALCGILVICGIIAPPTGKENKLLPADTNSKEILLPNITEKAGQPTETNQSTNLESEFQTETNTNAAQQTNDENTLSSATNNEENTVTDTDNAEEQEMQISTYDSTEEQGEVENNFVCSPNESNSISNQGNNENDFKTFDETSQVLNEENHATFLDDICMDIPVPHEPEVHNNNI